MNIPALSRLPSRRITKPMSAVVAFRDAIQHDSPAAIYALWIDDDMGLIESTRYPVDMDPMQLARDAKRLNSRACLIGRPHDDDSPVPLAADIDRAQDCRRVLKYADVRVVDYVIVGRHAVVSLALRGQL